MGVNQTHHRCCKIHNWSILSVEACRQCSYGLNPSIEWWYQKFVIPDSEGATIHVLDWNLVVLCFLAQVSNTLKFRGLLQHVFTALMSPSQHQHSSFSQRFSALAPPSPEQTWNYDILSAVEKRCIVFVSQVEKGILYPLIMHPKMK